MRPLNKTVVKRQGWKYLSMAAALERDILSGRYGVGDRLPSERALAREQDVTPMTVRGALQVLADKGLISREQGRGTFVSLPHPAVMPAAQSRKSIGLIGLNPSLQAGGNVINWQLRMRRLQGVVDAAFQLGIPLQTQVEIDPAEPLPRLIDSLSHFAGIVLHDESLSEAVLLALHERGMPMVAINCYLDTGYCARIHVNSRLGASNAVAHLITLGHRRIALIVGDAARVSMRERLQGYRDAHAAHGVPVDESLIVLEPRGWPQEAARAARQLLKLADRPTAIFTASDYRALGVLEALRLAGLRVPEDISVVGFDDICEAERTDPPLTTVANPLYASGRLALQLVQEQIESGRCEPSVRTLACSLKVRGSSCIAKLAAQQKEITA
jgi:DNA-binding LacI/PurR family transcriptional regulator